ncbi:MAG: endonuclease III [Patescibacteria group bacterium]
MTKKQKARLILEILTSLYPDPKAELNASSDYEFLFAVIMSAQTTDKQVNKLTEKLFLKYNSLESFIKTEIEDLANDMRSIGLYKSKANNIHQTAKILINEHNSVVPNDLDSLIKLPGVGKKTANVVLGDWYNNNVGIAVDTHVTRLANNLGLTKSRNPLKIEEDLKKLFPKDQWAKMSLRLILYGRYFYPAHLYEHEGPLSKLVVNLNYSKKNKSIKKSK